MRAITSHVTILTIVCLTVYPGADQRKPQNSGSLAFVKEIHQWPLNHPHKGPVTRKMFPFNDVIMIDTGSTLWGGWLSAKSIMIRSRNNGVRCMTFLPLSIDALSQPDIEKRKSCTQLLENSINCIPKYAHYLWPSCVSCFDAGRFARISGKLSRVCNIVVFPIWYCQIYEITIYMEIRLIFVYFSIYKSAFTC